MMLGWVNFLDIEDYLKFYLCAFGRLFLYIDTNLEYTLLIYDAFSRIPIIFYQLLSMIKFSAVFQTDAKRHMICFITF